MEGLFILGDVFCVVILNIFIGYRSLEVGSLIVLCLVCMSYKIRCYYVMYMCVLSNGNFFFSFDFYFYVRMGGYFFKFFYG